MKRLLISLMLLLFAAPALAVAPGAPAWTEVTMPYCAFNLPNIEYRWGPSSGDLAYYRIYRDDVHQFDAPYQYNNESSQRYLRSFVPEIEIGTTSDYYVVGVSSLDEEGPPGPTIQLTIPDCGALPTAPTGLVGVPDNGGVLIAWMKGSEGDYPEWLYRIYRTSQTELDSRGFLTPEEWGSASTPFLTWFGTQTFPPAIDNFFQDDGTKKTKYDSYLRCGERYYYWINCVHWDPVNGLAVSPDSNYVTIDTLPCP